MGHGTADDVLWALCDHQNSVRDLVSYDPSTDTTSVENHITYDAFGNKTESAAVDHLFKYTGRLFDEDTGLQNNLNRWYDPGVGRWLSEDPIGFGGGDANLYRYCSNWAMNATDPLGLGLWSWIWTGDSNASDEVWDAAMEGAGKYYLENAGDAHAALKGLGGAANGLGPAVSSTLALVEGEVLHAAVMNNGNRNPLGGAGNLMPGAVPPPPPPPQRKPQNPGQKTTEFIIQYGPIIIFIAGMIEMCNDGGGDEIVSEETPATKQTPTDLHAFGPKAHPRPPRLERDLGVDSPTDIVPGQSPPLPKGASTFGDPMQAPLSGYYHKIEKGTPLPEGLDVIPDGQDVLPDSPQAPTHHTIFPLEDMSAAEFIEKFNSLPWELCPTKKK